MSFGARARDAFQLRAADSGELLARRGKGGKKVVRVRPARKRSVPR